MDWLKRLAPRTSAGASATPSEALLAFLAEPELDNLRPPAETSGADVAHIRGVLGAWAPRRAVFNLLMHPGLIPADLRLHTLRQAIEQRDDAYLAIAGCCGIQQLQPTHVSRSWPDLRDLLLALLRMPGPVVQNRATVALVRHARSGDGEHLLQGLQTDHLDPSEHHNLFVALLRTGDDESVVAALRAGMATPKADPTAQQWLEDWQRSGERPDSPPPMLLGLPLFGYIPNLGDEAAEAPGPWATPAP